MTEDSGTMALTPVEPKATGMLANLMSWKPGEAGAFGSLSTMSVTCCNALRSTFEIEAFPLHRKSQAHDHVAR